VLTIPDPGGLDDIGVAILVFVALVVVVFVVVPPLLSGVELIILGLVLAASIAGRALLGRPWVVQASPVEGDAQVMAWKVSGWRTSAPAIGEVATALEADSILCPARPSNGWRIPRFPSGTLSTCAGVRLLVDPEPRQFRRLRVPRSSSCHVLGGVVVLATLRDPAPGSTTLARSRVRVGRPGGPVDPHPRPVERRSCVLPRTPSPRWDATAPEGQPRALQRRAAL
jgi:hypothetical protein